MGSLFERARDGLRRLAVRMRVACEAGQSTTEYTLVILVAASIALLMLNWAKGGAVEGFFQSIMDKVTLMFA